LTWRRDVLYLQTKRSTKMKPKYLNIVLAGSLILMAAAGRIMNAEMHFYNFAAVGALGLFAGAIIKDLRVAFLFTLLAQFSSDLYFELFTSTKGFYGIEQFFTYGGLMLVTLLGSRMAKPGAAKVAGYSIAGTLIFFLVSNFGVWMSIEFGRVDLYGYGKGFTGLMNTYIAALPFYRTEIATQLFLNSLIGDLLFSGLLFGAYYLIQKGAESKMQKARI
jgi:hypothetical protein